MEIVRLKLKDLARNEGQIEGLPTNPRQWTQTDIDRIAESLKETPELFEARPCIVYPHDGKYIILGGNLRYTGARKNGDKEVPCVVMPEGTPLDKLKEIVIKDNGSFGAWDYDLLANEWDSLPLTDWGVPAWETETEEAEVHNPEDDNYVRNIEAPIYEPTGRDVPIEECYNLDKFKELQYAITNSNDLSAEEKSFLHWAATRFVVFDYAKIADFYSNARPELQRLMEDSALVIIDFNKAIERGFVEVSKNLCEQYDIENESE